MSARFPGVISTVVKLSFTEIARGAVQVAILDFSGVQLASFTSRAAMAHLPWLSSSAVMGSGQFPYVILLVSVRLS